MSYRRGGEELYTDANATNISQNAVLCCVAW